MATGASVAGDHTTCPICLEMFHNTKSLPCLHAFCLKCLQGHFKDKCPGDEVPCPVCTKEFQIPDDGLQGIQHHFFMQQLVTVTVTEALVLRPLLEDRGCITESIRILVPVDRMKQKCFQVMTKQSHHFLSAPSVACSKLAVQQQKRLCGQFVDVSAAR